MEKTSAMNQTLLTHAVGGGLCLALLAAGYLLGIAPLLGGGAAQVDLSAEVRDAEANAAVQEAVVSRLEEELMNAQQTLEERPMRLQHAVSVNQRMSALSALIHAQGLALTASRTGDEAMVAFCAYIPIELGGEGRLGDFVALLGALSEQFPDMGVQQFTITRNPLGSGEFELTLNWFVQPARTAEVS